MTNTPPYDMSQVSYADLLRIIASDDNRNLDPRGAALAEKEKRDFQREDARAMRQMAMAQNAAKAARMAAWATIAAAIAAFLTFAVVAVTALPTINAAWFPQITSAQAPSSGAAPPTLNKILPRPTSDPRQHSGGPSTNSRLVLGLPPPGRARSGGDD
jgi:hypothetical protein